jgi:hypothetical protein
LWRKKSLFVRAMRSRWGYQARTTSVYKTSLNSGSSENMIYFKALLVLLWLSACAGALCSNATICVANGSGREAECPNFYHVFQRLSDLTANETSCNTVHIYLTGGTHILDKNFDLVEETKILGAPHGQPSTIECLGFDSVRTTILTGCLSRM